MNLDHVSEHYYGVAADPMTQRCRERIHWICQQVQGNQVLDVGCSQGIACLILGREGFECTGVDIEQASLDDAIKRLEKEEDIVRQRVKFQLATAFNLPFEDNSFDSVILGEILEHLTHPERVLQEAQRVLRDEGKVIVTVPYGLNAHHDHKRTYYPISFLETLQPYFRMAATATTSHYIFYSGVKDPSYNNAAVSGEPVSADYLRLVKDIEQRCLSKELALLETGTKWDGRVKALTEQLNELKRTIREKEQTIAGKERELDTFIQLKANELEEKDRQLHDALRVKELEIKLALQERERGVALEAKEQEVKLQVSELQLKDALEIKEQERRLKLQEQEYEAALAAKEQEFRFKLQEQKHKAALESKDRELAESVARINEEWHTRIAAREQEFKSKQDELERELRATVTAKDNEIKELKSHLVKQPEAGAENKELRKTDGEQPLFQRIREIARITLPTGARVLVISKGDDNLLQLDDRQGWHFPQTTNGVYAGYHPADSAAAIAHLEELRTRGAEYLLIPVTSFWWLEYYDEFRKHLETHYRVVEYQEDTCLIFAMRSAASGQRLLLEIRYDPKSKGGRLATSSAVQESRMNLPASSSVAHLQSGNGHILRDQVGNTATGPTTASDRVARPKMSRQGITLEEGKVDIGGILDEFTTDCLRPECNLITFRPDNWQETLEDYPPQAIFVESAWRGNDGAWQYRVAKYAKNMGDELNQLLHWAKERKIPSVFWNKEDPVHFERFIERAGLFDTIFTSDANCIPRYREQLGHERVFALPFAAQPAIHNPVLDKPRNSSVCFAGTYYGDRHQQRQNDMELILKPALAYGLEIYDRRYGVTGKDAEIFRFPDIYQPHIKGRLEYDEMVKAYKKYRVFLNVNSVTDSPTMFSRRVFELLACGTPVISKNDSKGIVDLLGDDVVFITESEADTKKHLDYLLGDNDAWARASARGIRRVMEQHTYSVRLKDVLNQVGISSPETNLPALTVVVKISEAHDINLLLSMLKKQTYRRFDLIVLSDAAVPNRSLNRLRHELGDISVANVLLSSQDVHAQCVREAHSEHFVIWDLRDYYGHNYLKDYALALTYSRSDLMGKHTFYKAADSAGQCETSQPGYEFRYVTSIPSATLVARKNILSKGEFMKCFKNRVFRCSDRRILSIDRFNYLHSAFPESDGKPAMNKKVVSKIEV